LNVLEAELMVDAQFAFLEEGEVGSRWHGGRKK
jgi:hypothetical protein